MRKPIDLDDLDRRVLRELQRDASQSNAELAERVGSTGPSCWRRIRILEEAGILTRTVRLVDAVLVGQGVTVICNIRLKSHSSEQTGSFEQFVQGEARIMDCLSMSGEWDYQIRVVARDVADYEAFLMQTLLKQETVGAASSHFALKVIKYQTAIPVTA